jgi:type VI secretion system protein ImpA
MAALDANVTALGEPSDEAAPPPNAALTASVAQTARSPDIAARGPAAAAEAVEAAPAAPSAPPIPLDPAVAALCTPISGENPCGPDLELAGDADYLNFFAQVEGVLPASFFDTLDGTPFDRTTVDIGGQLAAIKKLLARTRDIKLLIMQARLQILNRDLGGFAVSSAAAAYWLDAFWDQAHPRPESGEMIGRSTAISALDIPTVIFPLQYAPLFEARRLGTITYRRLMIANDEVKPRTGEDKLAASAIMEAVSEADPPALAAVRRHVAMLKSAVDQIRNTFAMRAVSAGLDNLPTLIGKIQAFIDPAAAAAEGAHDGVQAEQDAAAGQTAGPGPKSLAEASQALAAIADYYSRLEPSSPTLPLVRQAHQLIGKSFIEVMTILVPTQMETAAFQIGSEQVFDLPVGRLSDLSAVAPRVGPPSPEVSDEPTNSVCYSVKSRSQAIGLLDQVQRFFRAAEPSSPVPMLCERARALAERDFMGVLRDVLPKAALKNAAADK